MAERLLEITDLVKHFPLGGKRLFAPPPKVVRAVDVDFLWRHRFTDACFDLGLKLGSGVVSTGDAVILPIASVYAGFEF